MFRACGGNGEGEVGLESVSEYRQMWKVTGGGGDRREDDGIK